MPAPAVTARSHPWLRRLALGIVVGRYVIVLGVIPAIPFLHRCRSAIALLVLLRPDQGVAAARRGVPAGGARRRCAAVRPPSLPLMILVVWFFFIAGRAYQHVLRDGTGPRWLHRAIPPDKLELAQRMLIRRGPLIAVLGRLAAMPPTMLAAAAGVSDVSARRYLAPTSWGRCSSFASSSERATHSVAPTSRAASG
jgi:hypothetical protein